MQGNAGHRILNWKLKEDYQKLQNWDALIDWMKENVRDNCESGYRREMLFTSLVEAHRYESALQVVGDMTTRGLPMPHAVLAQAEATFLDSVEFKKSAIGIEFAERERQIQEAVSRAENTLRSLPTTERPPNPYLEDASSSSAAAVDPIRRHRRGDPGRHHSARSDGRDARRTRTLCCSPRHGSCIEGWRRDFFSRRRSVELRELLVQGKAQSGSRPAGRLWTERLPRRRVLFGSPVFLKKLCPEKEFRSEWWVKIREPKGKEGWVLNTGQFENLNKPD